ncbi:MAG: hypothetical protein AAFW70_09370 [Cyanobacteria bacterium J06635_10]
MNKKVLGLLAASTAVVGSAIFATPASAVTQDVEVNLTVDEVLFLKTFKTVELRVTQGDLSGNADSAVEEASTDGSNQLNLNGVRLNTDSGTTVTKEIDELYAVYSNDSRAQVQVRITVDPNFDKLFLDGQDDEAYALMTVDDDQFDTNARTIDEIDDDTSITDEKPIKVGGVKLKFDFKNDDGEDSEPEAGSYTGGVIVVEAISEGNFTTND